MCGRFNLRTSGHELIELFAAVTAEGLDPASITPRYNIAPTQTVVVVRRHQSDRVLIGLQWGLIPSWSKDPAIGNRLINARGETVATKPAFRAAFKRRRCLVLADGFYEWKKTGGRRKQPYHIYRQDERTFAFAGLWEHWESSDGSEIESCTIITTEPNPLMARLHDRMPVILDPADYDAWLDPDCEDRDVLEPLLQACPQEWLTADPIGTIVNNPRSDTPQCIEPVPVPEEQQDA